MGIHSEKFPPEWNT